MNHLSLIIKREYLTKVRNKSFIIMTFLTPVIMIGLMALVAYLTSLNNEKIREVVVIDQSGLFETQFTDRENLHFTYMETPDVEAAKDSIATTEAYGLLYIPDTPSIDELVESITFYSEDSPSLSIMMDIERIMENEINTLKLEEAGLDAGYIADLRVDVDTNLETFQGEETSKLGSGLKLVFGGISATVSMQGLG